MSEKISWSSAKAELGWVEGDPINIGHLCIDRHVAAGRGDRTALIHENHAGEVRRFTYRDVQELSNGWARFLADEGVAELDRVCLFLRPRSRALLRASSGFSSSGAVVQPLFSAFGEDSLRQRLEDCRTTSR